LKSGSNCSVVKAGGAPLFLFGGVVTATSPVRRGGGCLLPSDVERGVRGVPVLEEEVERRESLSEEDKGEVEGCPLLIEREELELEDLLTDHGLWSGSLTSAATAKVPLGRKRLKDLSKFSSGIFLAW